MCSFYVYLFVSKCAVCFSVNVSQTNACVTCLCIWLISDVIKNNLFPPLNSSSLNRRSEQQEGVIRELSPQAMKRREMVDSYALQDTMSNSTLVVSRQSDTIEE